MARELSEQFTWRSIHHLSEEFLPRIESALAVLPADDLWWRANEDCNSVGNLLLHLDGNVRQWILAGLGGQEDQRRRSTEFHVDANGSADELLECLKKTVSDASVVIAGMNEEELLRPRSIQGFETTGLAAVYHVVEHFSWHTGQIAFAAKMRAGRGHGLAFYDDEMLE